MPCQNEGPKNELNECTVRFVVAQLPCGSMDTSVACGPDSPRPKDCPGLGDPNTLKLELYNQDDADHFVVAFDRFGAVFDRFGVVLDRFHAVFDRFG